MGKTIVFCADGTWNGPDGLPATATSVTNVFRLFEALAGSDITDTGAADGECERELPGVQIGKYLNGVGVSSNPLEHLLGGGLGAGIIARIVRGYTFVSRNYVAGDRIVLTGFSRGAYTARALGGMIAAMGLLDAAKEDLSDRDAAYRAGVAVWLDYRRRAGQGDPVWLERIDALAGDFSVFLATAPNLSRVADVPIAAIGVWDTVGSLGIPDHIGSDGVTDVFRFADIALAPCVGHGFHAVSLDERRVSFVPTLWDCDPRIAQMLFPGAHADVGGGYPETDQPAGLAYCALGWMRSNLTDIGVRFSGDVPAANALGVAHQPWNEGVFATMPNAARQFPPKVMTLSEAVLSRLSAVVQAAPGATPARYAPENMPELVLSA